jgi:hypothetical protein
MGGGGGDALRLCLGHFQIGLRHSDDSEDLSIFFGEISTNVPVILTEKGSSVASVVHSIIDNEIDYG